MSCHANDTQSFMQFEVIPLAKCRNSNLSTWIIIELLLSPFHSLRCLSALLHLILFLARLLICISLDF